MITYRASLDVPIDTLHAVTGWLREHRRVNDTRPWQRAATVYVQAVMVMRWFKEATDLRILARDAGISIATAYRYLHEGIDVIAAHAPDLSDVLAQALQEDWAFVCLDGTLIATDRCRAISESGHDAWYSGKHKKHGGNVQVLCGPTGYPEWVSPAEPGSTHDITAAPHPRPPGALPGCGRWFADPDRQGLPRRRHRDHRAAQGPQPRPRQPDPQPAHQRTASTRRTRKRPAQTDLESNAPRHPRPGKDHRNHRRRARTPTSITRLPVRKPHYANASWSHRGG